MADAMNSNPTLPDDEIRARVARLAALLKQAEEEMVEIANLPRPDGWRDMLDGMIPYTYFGEVRAEACSEMKHAPPESEHPYCVPQGELHNLRLRWEELRAVDAEDLEAKWEENRELMRQLAGRS